MRAIERQTWANEVVPLSQRMTYLDLFRAAAALLVLTSAQLLSVEGKHEASVVGPTILYAIVTVLGGALWRLLRRRSLTLFGALIIFDGVYLAWITAVTGGSESPFRYLILLHLITVTLLASYRTGLKLALWHTLLLLGTFNLARADVIEAISDVPEEGGVARTVAFMTVFWLAAFVTASLAAVNERELRRRKVDVETLAMMATELETTTDSAALSEIIASNVRGHFGARRVAVLRIEDRRMSLWGSDGDVDASVKSFTPRGASVLLEIVRQRGTTLVASFDPKTDRGLDQLMPGARNIVIVPLTAEAGMVGALAIEYGERSARVARRAVEMLERFASHGALSLRNAILVNQMEELATVDGLTGVANRRSFDQVIAQEIARAGRLRKPVSLIIGDIDHFKMLNDTHGHLAGDDVLTQVAQVFQEGVREVDTVARYGGEEFAIVLPQCGPDEAGVRADALRKDVQRQLRKHNLTVSFGIATYPDHASSVDRLVTAADRALYRSKMDGRNRATIFRPETKILAASGAGRGSKADTARRKARRTRTKEADAHVA